MYGVDVAKYQPFYNSNNLNMKEVNLVKDTFLKDLTMNLIDFNIKL